MNRSFLIGRIAGIPIRVHNSLLLFLPLFAFGYAAPGSGAWGAAQGLLCALGLFASIVLHELGHSLVARSKGSHIVEILLLPIGGMARIAGLPKRPRDEVLTALAGPAVSIILGLLLLAAALFIPLPVLPANVCVILAFTNLFLAAFNLIPSFPMDGGRIFRAAITPRLGRRRATQTAMIIGRACAIGFVLWAFRPMLYGGSPRLMLLLIAAFVWQSSGAEARQVAWEEYEHPTPRF